MKVLSPERMAEYDRYAIETWGMPGTVLMENAGRSTYRLIKERFLQQWSRLAVICGRGNNGGDGFVVARYAFRDGFPVQVFLLSAVSDLKGDAALNMRLFRDLGGAITEVNESTLPLMDSHLWEADIIIDAIFGTGLSKMVEGSEGQMIEAINRSGKQVIAIDIPSGVDGRTGMAMGVAVEASQTFTYGYPKLGQMFYPGAYYAGGLTVIDISLPPQAEEVLGADGDVIDGDMIRGFLKKRLPWAHKGTFGHAVVVAGSPGKTGAAYMTSEGALKIGAGLVTLVVPKTLSSIMAVKFTEVMSYPVEDEGTGFFTLSAYEEVREFIADKDVVIVGPGLSQDPRTSELVRRLYSEVDMPFVVDADGINAFAGHLDMIREAGREAVFTPHPGELARLLGVTAADINGDRIGWGRHFVETTGANLILKGARTIIFSTDGAMFVNPTGNPGLAKGGSGDILTGYVGGAVSQGYSLIEASILGTYVHGYGADRCVEETTDMDLLARDLLAGLGQALRAIQDGTDRIYIDKSL
jgi:hydroxyethylthiazole kinase-like uncharacterized protein yjeF